MWIIAAEVGTKFIEAFTAAMNKAARSERFGGTLARIGPLEVRLATGKKEIRKAQRLRYEVFFRDGGAKPSARAALTRRDADRFDKISDHLIVIDHAATTPRGKTKPKVVGAYRLLRDCVARKDGGFYSQQEYLLDPLLSRHEGKRFLELGRSCVKEQYRGKRTIELLWLGILAYVRHYKIDVLLGCASFHGANPLSHAMALSFLAHHARAPQEWLVEPQPRLGVPMEFLDKEAVDTRKALNALPPLIKGYLRLGAKFGAGAVVDRKFNTTDVFVVMPVAEMDMRYLGYFGGRLEDRSHAA